jgi:hypothetical protein
LTYRAQSRGCSVARSPCRLRVARAIDLRLRNAACAPASAVLRGWLRPEPWVGGARRFHLLWCRRPCPDGRASWAGCGAPRTARALVCRTASRRVPGLFCPGTQRAGSRLCFKFDLKPSRYRVQGRTNKAPDTCYSFWVIYAPSPPCNNIPARYSCLRAAQVGASLRILEQERHQDTGGTAGKLCCPSHDRTVWCAVQGIYAP